jgi:hypothetical protein
MLLTMKIETDKESHMDVDIVEGIDTRKPTETKNLPQEVNCKSKILLKLYPLYL